MDYYYYFEYHLGKEFLWDRRKYKLQSKELLNYLRYHNIYKA